MFRMLTVAREFGSGGGLIGRRVAETLGWNLLDKALVEEIARSAHVDPKLASRYDERVDPWLHRVVRHGFLYGAEGIAAAPEGDVFDAESMAALGKKLIMGAYTEGNCVIIGRGAQCVLQDKADVFHVFVYAPWDERVQRIRERYPDAGDVEHLIRTTDYERAEFLRLYFGCDWKNPHYYHMMISSELGEDEVASVIIRAMQRDENAYQRPGPADRD